MASLQRNLGVVLRNDLVETHPLVWGLWDIALVLEMDGQTPLNMVVCAAEVEAVLENRLVDFVQLELSLWYNLNIILEKKLFENYGYNSK